MGSMNTCVYSGQRNFVTVFKNALANEIELIKIRKGERKMSKKPFVTKEQLDEIVKTYPTPFHLYDEKGIRENAKALKEAFAWNPGYKEYFAVKATPNPFLLDILKEYGCGCDCSSYTELMLSEAVGVTGHNIMFSSNDTPERISVLLINLERSSIWMILHILTSLKVQSDIFLRQSVAVIIRAAYSRSVMILWIIREIQSMV